MKLENKNSADLTQGSISHHLLRIGLPASTGLLFNTLYNVTDTWYAGKISTNALAGLSLSFPAFLMILALGSGIGTASVVLISNALGAGKQEKTLLYFTQSFLMGSILAILLLVFRTLYVRPLFILMGAHGEALDMAVSYMEMIIVGIPFFLLNNILNSMLNARGNTKSYRNVLIVGFFINLGLDPLFLYGFWIIPAMGIKGIAFATVFVQFIAFFYLWHEVAKIKTEAGQGILICIKASFVKFFTPHRKIIAEIAAQAVPAILNTMSIALGMFVINYYLNTYADSKSIAAYGVGLRIEQIFLLPAMGISTALLAITGQNFGAKKIDRVKKVFKVALGMGAITLGLAIIVLVPFAQYLVSLFSDDATVIGYAVFYLHLEVIAYYCYILLPCANSLLQGMKKPAFVMWIGFSRQLIAPAILFYLICGVLGMQARGIFVGIAIINWLAALIALSYTLYSLRKYENQLKESKKE